MPGVHARRECRHSAVPQRFESDTWIGIDAWKEVVQVYLMAADGRVSAGEGQRVSSALRISISLGVVHEAPADKRLDGEVVLGGWDEDVGVGGDTRLVGIEPVGDGGPLDDQGSDAGLAEGPADLGVE